MTGADDLPVALSAQLALEEATERLVIATYDAVPAKILRPVLLVEYRCRLDRCLLFHAWQSPNGIRYYRPPFKMSKGLNEATSVPDARRSKTNDGDRRWRARAGELDGIRSWPQSLKLRMQCLHVIEDVPGPMIVADAERATPGQPARRLF